MRLSRKLGAALVLVALGRLLSPVAIPVYDGISAPDEPYRYVSPPPGYPRTSPPTEADASSPIVAGRSTNGMPLASAEQGPQFSLFVPQQALAARAGVVRITAIPLAPTDQPAGARIDGDVYLVRITSPSGRVTMTDKAALAMLYLRATTARQPGPVMEYRPAPSVPWKALQTSRGGQDVYVSTFPGPGQYALAFTDARGGANKGGSTLPYLLLGGLVLIVVVVVVVRLRAAE